jgi:hypothetical protein
MEVTVRDQKLFQMLQNYALFPTSEIGKRIFNDIGPSPRFR